MFKLFFSRTQTIKDVRANAEGLYRGKQENHFVCLVSSFIDKTRVAVFCDVGWAIQGALVNTVRPAVI